MDHKKESLKTIFNSCVIKKNLKKTKITHVVIELDRRRTCVILAK